MASNVTIYNDVFGSDHGSFLTLCLNTPPKINSDGIWEFVFGAARKLRFSPLPLLEFQMLLIFFVNIILHSFLRLFGLPLFVSQIITGLILGSSWRGSFESFDNFKDGVFATASQEIVGLLAGFGYTLFVFLIGVRMDLSVVKRSGRQSLIGGILSIVIPAILGFVDSIWFIKI
ncbi:cation/H(+) antiporter 8-like [Cucumis sativus]|uniref:cation/H(+) antiporter 8-like n=1 Tax=Cucumis sativus TaxID=3659 RepID=UPI0012F477BD|nr:cation/H(+) antiporter 8-like [Cucumis sativus]